MTAVRFIEENDEWFIEGLIMPNGGPLGGQDLQGSHFTKSTDYAEDWFPNGGRPGIYRHGFDDALELSVVGREQKSWRDPKGVWLRAQIDKAHEYAAEIKEMLDQGLLQLSSGAVDHLVKISAKSGEITRWPWVEWSLVPNPANPEALLYQVKSADAIEHLRIISDEVPAEIAEEAVKEAEPNTPDPDALRREPPALVGFDGRAIDVFATALKEALNAQALHDAAVKSGAKCEEPPAPSLVIVAGKEAESPTPEEPVDLMELAVKTAAEVGPRVAKSFGL